MNNNLELNQAKQYMRDLTGGSLLIAETRLVAETLLFNITETDWNRLFTEENILRKKSKLTAIRYARCIKRRLAPLGRSFIETIMQVSESEYKQLLMLALMIQTPVVPDFMQQVIAETKRVYKPGLSADAWESFLQDRIRILPGLALLSESTLKKSGTTVIRSLVEAGYLDNNKNRRLQPVYVLPETKIWLHKLNRPELEPILECTL